MTPLLANRPRTDRSFERLYQRHVGDVYRYSLAVLRNQADAEDVTQTTFLNAYRAYQRGERPQAPHNWLIAIAHNVCRQRFRQSARRPLEVEFEDDIATSVVDEDEVGPTAEDIRRALGHLAFNQRAALVMRELEGRSYTEIAEILDVSVSAVETLIFRARRALREQLEGSLTCGEAELAISKQLDGRLSRAEKGQLRAHLRECAECATFARRQRAQRAALKSLGAVPLPTSLATFFGGGGSVIGGAIAVKAAAVIAAGAVVGGVGYEAAHKITQHRPPGTRTVATSGAARDGTAAAMTADRVTSDVPAGIAAAHAAVATRNHGAAATGEPAGRAVRAKHVHAQTAKTKARAKARAAHHAKAKAKRVRAHGAPANAHRTRTHPPRPHARPSKRAQPKHAKHTPTRPRPQPQQHPPKPQPHKPKPAAATSHSQQPEEKPKAKSVTDVLPTVSVPELPDPLPHGKK